jgi:hypothetical protein
MIDSKRLEDLWTPSLAQSGGKVLEVLRPELDRIMTAVYVYFFDIKPEQVTAAQITRGHVKFENILKGIFSAEYFEVQRKTTTLLIEQGIDFAKYLQIYALYHRECALCLSRANSETGAIDPQEMEALCLALQCDATVSMSCYFNEMQKENDAIRQQSTAAVNQRIMEVSTTISSFSTQTKMLAINASIEAARAGDVGKGFAVVASEIRTMASKVHNATEQIEKLALTDPTH